MHNDRAGSHAENLLSQMGWLRGLARGLARDVDAADDLAQDAALAALEDPSARRESLRAWLAGVLRNRARMRERSELRRRRRDLRAARGEALRSSADLVEQVSTQRAVVDAVLRLEEPYREVVLLRYFEDLPPRRIAQRLQQPVNTVKTRLQRGLARLRLDLDARHGGDRNTWLLALLPLAQRPLLPLGTLGGALTASSKIKITAAALVVVAGVAVAVAQLERPQAQPAAQVPSTAVEPAAPVSAPGPAQGRRPERAAGVAAMPAEEGTPAAPVATFRGRLLDAQGAPLPWVEVGLQAAGASQPADARAMSDAGGSFELPAPEEGADVVVTAADYATVLRAHFQRGQSIEPVVVAAPLLPLAGRVQSNAGTPLPGASIRVNLPEGFRTRFQAILDASVEDTWSANTDSMGAFELPTAPQVAGATLEARREGYEPWLRPLPAYPDRALSIVLEPMAPEAGSVEGQVVDPAGALVAGSYVTLGSKSTRADELGRFRFDLGTPQEGRHPLVAVQRGFQPGRMDPPGGPGTGASGWPSFVLLRLGPEPLAISGRVVHGDGTPAGGVKVWATDPTRFAKIDSLRASVEGLLGGGATEEELMDRLKAAASQDEAERIYYDTPNVMWCFARSDADGRFRLEGLLPRDYRLRVMDPQTLLMEDFGPLAAGREDVTLTLAPDALYASVSGRVLDRFGSGVAGARVFPMCDAFALEHEGGTTTMHAVTGATTTDAEGRFTLPRVPRRRVYLRVEGDDIMPMEFSRGLEGGLGEAWTGAMDAMEIVVSRRVHFQVELADPAEADQLAMADGRGHLLVVNQFSAGSREEREMFPLVDGKSAALAVPDTAEALVLYRDGSEVRRVPVRLQAGDLNVLRP
ncbi:MAG: sigma-70 family RNA polymerase sigma factor [Planctomycetota bacterium]|nr:MAG: sigma-70 family RNA polymerase sigma factor [Planctomycetota bacterium]